MSIVYGPVDSWELGRSLGIDPICREPKVCSLNCIYCQFGRNGMLTTKRSEFVQVPDLIDELEKVDLIDVEAALFSGTGEPMLASNLREMAEVANERLDLPLVLQTNSCHFLDEDAMRDIAPFDIVIATMDAATEATFRRVNLPSNPIMDEEVLEGLERARKSFRGSFRLQLMFLEENKRESGMMADLCREIDPDIVYINTPFRPCASQPLSREEIAEIASRFREMRVESVYG
jgi:wyosine [tRNA(Phe)-imidazoG37] synthetase (radical SAM superfamily)